MACADSDVDLIILTSEPLRYVNDTPWTETFGIPLFHNIEHDDPVQSVRVATHPGWRSSSVSHR